MFFFKVHTHSLTCSISSGANSVDTDSSLNDSGIEVFTQSVVTSKSLKVFVFCLKVGCNQVVQCSKFVPPHRLQHVS